jgi:CDP-ribitol ribitolphosphotransferase
LVAALKAGDVEDGQQKRLSFTQKMYKYFDGESTERVVKLIQSIMEMF